MLFCGGPFAQADCDGSCVGVLADAVEPLLIEFRWTDILAVAIDLSRVVVVTKTCQQAINGLFFFLSMKSKPVAVDGDLGEEDGREWTKCVLVA